MDLEEYISDVTDVDHAFSAHGRHQSHIDPSVALKQTSQFI